MMLPTNWFSWQTIRSFGSSRLARQDAEFRRNKYILILLQYEPKIKLIQTAKYRISPEFFLNKKGRFHTMRQTLGFRRNFFLNKKDRSVSSNGRQNKTYFNDEEISSNGRPNYEGSALWGKESLGK